MSPLEILSLGTRQIGLSCSQEMCERLLAFAGVLKKWNQKFSLTAISDDAEIVTHHLLDSLSIIPHLPPGRLADVGSGIGMPGLVIAIVDRGREIVLNDSSEKKSAFMRQAVIELGLRNVAVHRQRVEDWVPAARFAVAVTRAFVSVGRFCELARHLIAPGGALLAMKGDSGEAERLQAPASCGCGMALPLHVPFLGKTRTLVVCQPGALA